MVGISKKLCRARHVVRGHRVKRHLRELQIFPSSIVGDGVDIYPSPCLMGNSHYDVIYPNWTHPFPGRPHS